MHLLPSLQYLSGPRMCRHSGIRTSALSRPKCCVIQKVWGTPIHKVIKTISIINSQVLGYQDIGKPVLKEGDIAAQGALSIKSSSYLDQNCCWMAKYVIPC